MSPEKTLKMCWSHRRIRQLALDIEAERCQKIFGEQPLQWPKSSLQVDLKPKCLQAKSGPNFYSKQKFRNGTNCPNHLLWKLLTNSFIWVDWWTIGDGIQISWTGSQLSNQLGSLVFHHKWCRSGNARQGKSLSNRLLQPSQKWRRRSSESRA